MEGVVATDYRLAGPAQGSRREPDLRLQRRHRPIQHLRALDQAGVRRQLQAQSVEQRDDSPRRGIGIVARHRAFLDPLDDAGDDQSLPGKVQPTRRRPQCRPAAGLCPCVEPHLEHAVFVGARVRSEEARRTSRSGCRMLSSPPQCLPDPRRAASSNAAASTSSIDSK